MMKIAGESTIRNLRHKSEERSRPSSTLGGEEQPQKEQNKIAKLTPERDRFLVPHAARDPKILKDRNLENKDIFELIETLQRYYRSSLNL